jgi:hypothetical protein
LNVESIGTPTRRRFIDSRGGAENAERRTILRVLRASA